MKKFINEPADVLADALRGVAAAHPRLRVDHENRVIFRAEGPRRGKVGLVSGGGSGHEPLHGGFVGGRIWQTLVALTGLVPAFLAVTGFLFWRRRRGR